jgi:trehalose-phosphatase
VTVTAANRSALAAIAEIVDRVRRRRAALFLDFDGTLSPIVSRPQDAQLPPDTRRVLAALSLCCPVAVISGRALADVRARVALDELAYAGNHGFELALPGDAPRLHPEAHSSADSIRAISPLLAEQARQLSEAIFEDKGPTLTVHYRQCDAATAAQLQRRITALVEEFPGLEWRAGKKVIEVRPDSHWGKGHAMRWVLKSLGLNTPQTLPIFIGDDITDEDAFRELAQDGVGIRVGAPDFPTAAAYGLADTVEVQVFLEQLLAALQGPG